jgi:paraquat-inducible protein B
MSENNPAGGQSDSPEEPPEGVVERGRSFSPIWLIPIIVALVGVSLVYDAVKDRGVAVTLLFDSADGLVAGKSMIKYRDIEIGSVDTILLRDIDTVEVGCTITKRAAKHLTEDAAFWIVRPRIGGGGISGLETIVSGAYVGFIPGTEGKTAQREFEGLDEPPLPARDTPGLALVLHSDQLRGLEYGTAVYFRDIEVGDVLHHALAEDGESVEVKIVVMQKYAHLVTSQSRFWDAGGVDVSVGPSGLNVKTESLRSIIHGGITFDSPPGGTPAEAGDEFWLHASLNEATQSAATHGGLRVVLEAGSLGSVAAGNPVYYREVPVGTVVSHKLSKDGTRVRIYLNIEPEYATFVRDNSVFWNASGISADLGLTGLHLHAESLKTILAGGVSFATPPHPGHTVSPGSVFRLHPEAKKAWLEWETDYTPKKNDPPEKHSPKGRFFHHSKKSEEEASKEAHAPETHTEEKKRGLLGRFFHRGD